MTLLLLFGDAGAGPSGPEFVYFTGPLTMVIDGPRRTLSIDDARKTVEVDP